MYPEITFETESVKLTATPVVEFFSTNYNDLLIRICEEPVSDPYLDCPYDTTIDYLPQFMEFRVYGIQVFREEDIWICINPDCTRLVGACVRGKNLGNLRKSTETSSRQVCTNTQGEN
jgi:hypothetical protein